MRFFVGHQCSLLLHSLSGVIVKIQLSLHSRSVYNQFILSRHKSLYEKITIIYFDDICSMVMQ